MRERAKIFTIVIILLFLCIGGLIMHYETKLDKQQIKHKVVIGLYDGLIDDYDEVTALMEIRIDQLKTQLEDCTGFSIYGVSL